MSQRSEACIRPDRACRSRLPASQWPPMQSSHRVVAQWVPQQAPRGKPLFRFSLTPSQAAAGQLSVVAVQTARDPRTATEAEASRKRQGAGAGKFLDSKFEVAVSAEVRLPVCAGLCRSTVTSAESRSESKLLEARNSVSVQCQISVRPARGEHHAKSCSNLCYIKQAGAMALTACICMCM